MATLELFRFDDVSVPRNFHQEQPFEVAPGWDYIHWFCSVGIGNNGPADFRAHMDYLLDGVWVEKSGFTATEAASSEANVRAIPGQWRYVVDTTRRDNVSALIELTTIE